jgi:hypothetical protein
VVSPEQDVTPAAWLVEAVESGHGALDDQLPGGFPAYARVLHPPHRGEPGRGDARSWAEVAARHGTTLHPEANFDRLARVEDAEGGWDSSGDPSDGTLDPGPLLALRDLLSPHTTTSDDVCFALWRGGGTVPSAWESMPTFALPGRDYWLFRGALVDVVDISLEFEHAGTDELAARGELKGLFGSSPRAQATDRKPVSEIERQVDFARGMRAQGRVQSPSLWWPHDRAWVVATDVDLNSTYIAGSAALLESLLGQTAVEVLAVDAHMHVYDDADTIN